MIQGKLNVKHIPPPEHIRLILSEVDSLSTLGDLLPLTDPLFAVFCSVKCPASIILKTYDLAQRLKDHKTPVISGFHSPVEQEMLVTLLRGEVPIIVCPARSIDKMRIPAHWKPHIENGRMGIVSPFPDHLRRATQESAATRNHLVAALASQVFIAYAEPGGKTEAFARTLIADGVDVRTFDTEQTQNLLESGAKTLDL
jgi:predicted Rossmann fold nucleotide-binding protein DprA/Smf involved in DNA uptake